MPQPLLSLTDEEYATVMQAAGPVLPSQRDAFLRALADALAQQPIVGPGVVHRLAAHLQRHFVVQARTDAETRKGETNGHRGPRQAGPGRAAEPPHAPAGPEAPAA